MFVTGIDVSIYQGKMNWQTAKEAGVKVGIIRLGIGIYKDTMFEENYAKAKEANIDLISAYHVFYPPYDPISQSEFVNEQLKDKKLDIHLWIDVEINSNLSPYQYSTNLWNYMQAIEIKRKGIYTRGEWWNTNIGYYYNFGKYPLWIARYNSIISHPWSDNPTKYRPKPWNNFVIWQWSADGNGRGSEFGAESRHIDINRIRYWYYKNNYLKKAISNKIYIPLVSK